MKEKIKYKGGEYSLRAVNIIVDGKEELKIIGSHSLSDALFDENGEYGSNLAQVIDQGIYFYAPDELFSEPDAVLAAYVAREAN